MPICFDEITVTLCDATSETMTGRRGESSFTQVTGHPYSIESCKFYLRWTNRGNEPVVTPGATLLADGGSWTVREQAYRKANCLTVVNAVRPVGYLCPAATATEVLLSENLDCDGQGSVETVGSHSVLVKRHLDGLLNDHSTRHWREVVRLYFLGVCPQITSTTHFLISTTAYKPRAIADTDQVGRLPYVEAMDVPWPYAGASG